MSPEPLIVIVDDDESSGAAILGLVRALGFQGIAFATARSFLDSAELERAACLVADVQMPGTTGLELHRGLVAAGRSIPVVLVTAYPDEAGRRRALAAGVAGYLTKPLSPEALLAALGQALSQGLGRR